MLEVNKIYHGDCLELLKDVEDCSIDSIITDPPYGYSFMGMDWDKQLPDINIWKECYRVLKDGAFMFCVFTPRQDMKARFIIQLIECGFKVDFTPIYWTYATGFKKCSKNLSFFDSAKTTFK